MSLNKVFDLDAAQLTPEERDLIARRQRLLGPVYRLSYERPLHIVRGEGVYLHAADGRRYLDAYNNVAGVGHCHPHVVAALTRQAAILNTHTRYLTDGILSYAERLLATFPAEAALAHMMFTCTGSEANDLAYRFAQAHTGGTGFIITRFAYHGGTKVIAELSPSLGAVVAGAANVRTVAPPDPYRGEADVGAAFARGVQAAVDDLRAHGITPAALIVDTIFASDGVFADPPGFLQAAAQVIRDAGGLFIADEVQGGFGRTGAHLWGFERHGLRPDIVTMGKAMGAGHPMAGLALKSSVVADFGRQSRYFNTFGGNPVSAAVGMAVLDVLEREGLAANAHDTGEHLRAGLRALAERHATIGDVRGAGLMTGVELVRDRGTREPAVAEAARVVNGLRERGVLISYTGEHANILKIRPPLPFSRTHADLLLDALDQTLGALDP